MTTATTSATPTRTPGTWRHTEVVATAAGWVVLWEGVRHGGIHIHHADAVAHAQKLEAAEDRDRLAWVAEIVEPARLRGEVR